MYVILVYDIKSDKGGQKVLATTFKTCKKYLTHIQNSVFEGEISEVRLKELLMQCEKFIDKTEDSIIIFSGQAQKALDKMIIGKERSSIDIFL